ncbi:alcohol dehydrogenase catalytic domain-containing protein [Amycolatopsis rhabdoformis]|uniref:Alcohol dehydrogenase catalytic domain-containing protein n=1 Tax=Amycolatopsis rhabdoformis TaxID=1448059 RepID=A0ABZ1IIK5_9PSEU|nr:alcohol dehydrogenase catalytic domain-containing protein [Amycolatopsis rhabdoformis]WSE33611.1 alcohol dehydrogenase catalytic domain-containing protein [Amycolatopsis rhabdoformis]
MTNAQPGATLAATALPTTMPAVIFRGEGVLSLEERPVPAITAPDDIVIKVGAVGICGSDLHALHTPPTHPGLPGVIFGHEFCGEIVATGPEARGLAVGDRVAVDQNPPCGRCGPCRDGNGNFCEPLFDNPHLDIPWPNTPGFFWDGGMAEYVKVPSYFAYRVGADVPWEHLVLAEPLGCVLNGIGKAGVAVGDRAVVLGGGPMGLLTVIALKHFGVEQVILVEPAVKRAEVARQAGADLVINPAAAGVREEVLAATGGRGATVVVEAVGNQLDTAVGVAADRARIVVLGINNSYRANLSAMTVTIKELRILGSFLMRYTMRESLDLIQSGELPLERVVSHVLPLSEVHHGISLARAGEGLKIVFKP